MKASAAVPPGPHGLMLVPLGHADAGIKSSRARPFALQPAGSYCQKFGSADAPVTMSITPSSAMKSGTGNGDWKLAYSVCEKLGFPQSKFTADVPPVDGRLQALQVRSSPDGDVGPMNRISNAPGRTAC